MELQSCISSQRSAVQAGWQPRHLNFIARDDEMSGMGVVFYQNVALPGCLPAAAGRQLTHSNSRRLQDFAMYIYQKYYIKIIICGENMQQTQSSVFHVIRVHRCRIFCTHMYAHDCLITQLNLYVPQFLSLPCWHIILEVKWYSGKVVKPRMRWLGR